MVHRVLKQSAYAFIDSQNFTGLPLDCWGTTEFIPPEMSSEEVCELWFGPLGEQIYWIRPEDSRMSHYLGANPIKTKQVKTRAYFFFSERTHENPLLSWSSFRDAFRDRPVAKIMCTTVAGEDPKTIGFSEPDSLDLKRMAYFSRVFSESPTRKLSVEVHQNFDTSFVSKLAIGIAYTLFGPNTLFTPYMTELHKALWYKKGDSTPLINGSTLLSESGDNTFDRLSGEENAVTVTIAPNDGNIVIILNLSARMSWTVVCARADELSTENLQQVGEGICILLYRPIQKGLCLTWPKFIAYKCGEVVNPDLVSISKMLRRP